MFYEDLSHYAYWDAPPTARFPGIRFPWIPDDAVLRHVDEE
ncbi:hypothetical protein ACFWIO_31060 [Streptomyces diastatochromogenes]